MDVFLEKLELHGFKSFPDKTVMKFHKGITAVIGPNGCGKSNIVDAILWVLGEQRIKNLRGENNEDLIFNGSVSKKPLGMTEVSSYFMNQGEPVSISRRFFRSGESKYILNDKYCRNKDIQDALFGMRMGERKYFIFEQGSIDRLIQLKPSEKRLLIEEAAGISQYLERKKETTNKLIIAQQNLENIEILVTDKGSRLKELKNQANYVGRFRKLKTERNDILKTYLKKQHRSYEKDFNHFKTEIEKLINQETMLVKDISNMEKIDIQLEEKIWRIDRELKQNQQDIFNTNRSILSQKNEIDKSLQKNDFDKQKIVERKQAIKTNEAEEGSIRQSLKTEQARIDEIEKDLKAEQEKGRKGKQELSKLQEDLEKLQQQQSGMNQELFNVQSEKSRFSNQILNLNEKAGRTRNEIEGKKKFILELKNQINGLEIDRIQGELNSLQEKIKGSQDRLRQTEEAEMASRNRKDALEKECQGLGNEISNLEIQKNKYTEIKKKIMGVENQDSPPPQTGFLQDTIEVSEEYRQIVESFFYDELDAIPVREEALPRGDRSGKFLIFRDRKPIPGDISKEKGFVSFVRDLFSPGDESLNALLKNGVLADTLGNAIRIYKKFGVNVVTRNAEIINKDGLLMIHRKKGILNVIDEIRKIENRKTQLTAKMAASQKSLDRAAKEQAECSGKVEDQRRSLNSLKENELQLSTTLRELKKNRETYWQRIKLNESEVELLSLEIEKNRSELKEIKKKDEQLAKKQQETEKQQSEIQDQIRQLEDRINQTDKHSLQQDHAVQILQEKLQSHGNKKRELSNLSSRLASSIKLFEKEIEDLEINLVESKKSISELELSTQSLEKKKEELESRIKNQEMEFDRLNGETKANTAALKQKRSTLDELKERKKELEIDFSAIKKDLFQLNELAFKELNIELEHIEEDPEFKDRELSELKNLYESSNDRMIKMRDSDRLNFSAESEYEILSKDHDFLLKQKSDIEHSIQNLNDAITKIDHESQTSFLDAFNQIKEYYRKNFRILFEGGEAELMLSDESNITETGLEIKAQPPGKKLQSLRLLSGGEKTLASLAFLFALFEYKPSPFCVFDEVDAALDEANVKRFLKFVHKLKEKTQFLIITHNFKTMEEADYIYGITMNAPGVSTIYSMKIGEKNRLMPEQ